MSFVTSECNRTLAELSFQFDRNDVLLPWLRCVHLSNHLIYDSLLTNSITWEAVLEHLERRSGGGINELELSNRKDLVPLLLRVRHPFLLSLELNGCDFLSDEHLRLVAANAPHVRKLHLARCFGFTAEGLEAFSQSVEDLSISMCRDVRTIPPAMVARLHTLHANYTVIGDEDLAPARRLRHLFVRGCRNISSVEPFAATLQVLDASYMCGIGDAGLVAAHSLVKLDLTDNTKITTVEPFGSTLRELIAPGNSGLTTEGLRHATALAVLDVSYNTKVAAVPLACGPTLRALDIQGECAVNDRALSHLTGLVVLRTSENQQISTVSPFAKTLRFLYANGTPRLGDAGLTKATSLMRLDASHNERITSVAPFAATLFELVANGTTCGLSDAALQGALNLRSVHARENFKISGVPIALLRRQQKEQQLSRDGSKNNNNNSSSNAATEPCCWFDQEPQDPVLTVAVSSVTWDEGRHSCPSPCAVM